MGGMGLDGVDGIPPGGLRLRDPRDPSNPAKDVNVTCGTGKYVCDNGPGFSFIDGFFDGNGKAGNGSRVHPYPPQAVNNAVLNGARGNAVEMFARAQLPVKAAVADSFGVFNKLFTSSPTPSWPNHMFIQTGMDSERPPRRKRDPSGTYN